MTTRLKVWEAVRAFAQISVESARGLCIEYLTATGYEHIDVEDYADDSVHHIEFIEFMYDICSQPADYNLDFDMDFDFNFNMEMAISQENPFFYSMKVNVQDVDRYLALASDDNYYCTICGDNYDHSGVRLSCANKNNCCTYCKECIVPWITEQVAKCPNCMEYLQPLTDDAKLQSPA
jgi:hypothetical protein